MTACIGSRWAFSIPCLSPRSPHYFTVVFFFSCIFLSKHSRQWPAFGLYFGSTSTNYRVRERYYSWYYGNVYYAYYGILLGTLNTTSTLFPKSIFSSTNRALSSAVTIYPDCFTCILTLMQVHTDLGACSRARPQSIFSHVPGRCEIPAPH